MNTDCSDPQRTEKGQTAQEIVSIPFFRSCHAKAFLVPFQDSRPDAICEKGDNSKRKLRIRERVKTEALLGGTRRLLTPKMKAPFVISGIFKLEI